MNAYSSCMCDSPKLETIQMLIGRWLDEHIVVYPHRGILFSSKKEWMNDTCGNMDESQSSYAEWKTLDIERVYPVGFHLYKLPKIQPYDSARKQTHGCLGWWSAGRLQEGITKNQEGIAWIMTVLITLITMIPLLLYTHQNLSNCTLY